VPAENGRKYVCYVALTLVRPTAMQTREWNNVYYDVCYYSVWFRFFPISNSVLDTVDVNFTSQDEKYRVGFCKNPFDLGL
jgi:hypothetical protein